MSSKDAAKMEIVAEHFPALRAFLRGYFHQDMKDEYGSLEEATRQFCEDADSAERKAVEKEIEIYRETLQVAKAFTPDDLEDMSILKKLH